MIRDEDVIKSNTGKYMKPHEKVLYTVALILGATLVITGIAVLILSSYSFGLGIILIIIGVVEMIGVGLILWTEGVKKDKRKK